VKQSQYADFDKFSMEMLQDFGQTKQGGDLGG
jgi:hypothetical protein